MIQPVSALTPKARYKGKIYRPERPIINRNFEKNLAMFNSLGISAVCGAAITVVARAYTSSWKHAGIFGASAAAATMLFVYPGILYKKGLKTNNKENANS